MPGDGAAPRPWEEIADLLTSAGWPEEIMAFRPSHEVQQRVRELLHKSGRGEVTVDEERELLQCEQAELLMRLVKARLIPSTLSSPPDQLTVESTRGVIDDDHDRPHRSGNRRAQEVHRAG